jgi:hypothetical protein
VISFAQLRSALPVGALVPYSPCIPPKRQAICILEWRMLRTRCSSLIALTRRLSPRVMHGKVSSGIQFTVNEGLIIEMSHFVEKLLIRKEI